MSKWTDSLFMRRFGVPYSVFLVMIMNTIYAFAREPVSYHTLRIDNLDIFYREAGPKNAPVLLLLHGVPTSSRMYQPMLESPLSARYRLIAPDFPGFGHSSWPGPKQLSYTFDHLAQVTERFADELKLNRYTLYLHDYGGPVGMRMAVATPRKSKPSSSKMRFPTKKACRRSGQGAARSGKIGRRMRLRSGKLFSRWRQPATGTWAHLRILSALIPTPGRTSSTS